ncbi:hypothetical protein IMW82_08720 [Rhodanobacter sp. B2A1Ga4]|uniref:DUF5916 domain-containing protein n=1 Tax=Rhodanobacter TaxID=75309 RepID=UPI000D3ADF25|nr:MULTISPECIES: DUF5916 domain-containing protein [Rhodanobacter]MBQ4854753.1 hypothetical protein [Rhodanobacter sp. B2A1Ga4]
MRMACLLLLILAALSAPALAVEIDGHIGADEWKGARHIADFRQTQPLTGKPGSLHTEAWILATPKGLAVAFRCDQPAGVPRTHQRVQRDFEDQVDRVNVMIDFNGDGRTGYDFVVSSTGGINDAVVTNENQFNKDWDGSWQHAVSEDAEGWTVEILIPWYIAPMHTAVDGKRTIGIYLDRVTGSTGERDSWPVASFTLPRFLSTFSRVEVPQYSQSLLALTPYVSGLYDNVRGRSHFQQGADLLWKPNGQFQLTAALNPDFGQVESDDLVVNFSATETYVSDKRPFFTENQGIFDFSLLDDYSQLVYTRRVGGPSDDGHGAADINAAVKLNGSFGTTSYGVLAADEDGEAGRFFGAARVTHDFGEQSLGMLLTRVDRPWLDREATVLGVDHHWRPTPQLTIATNVVGSDILQSGTHTRDSGGTVIADYEMGDGWRQQWLGMHFGDQLQVNDFGYLERNNFNYGHWEVRKRNTTLPADSAYSSHEWRFRIDGLDNDHGLRLRRQFRVSRNSNLRNGATETVQLNVNSAGWDDLLTRGNGALFLPPSVDLAYKRISPRHGDWAFKLDAEVVSGGLGGNRQLGYDVKFIPTYFVSDAFSVYAGPYYEHLPDWLVWQHDNLIGRYDEHTLQLDAGFDWTIDSRQELRVKLQAIGLDARVRGGYRVQANGRAVASNEPVDDFSVRNLGLQIRYRYELAPLSYLYVVYGRGGYAMDGYARRTADVFDRSFALRDDEQLLVKLSYRFDI